jgi:copper chaperone
VKSLFTANLSVRINSFRRGSVGELKGVSSVKVDLKAAKVDVECNNQEVEIDKIKETIEDQGYDVK